MEKYYAKALAHPNIALIKYWGNRNETLRIPQNDSISFNLNELYTITEIEFNQCYTQDELLLNGESASKPALERMNHFLDIIRKKVQKPLFAHVKSQNNFPTSAGIASSASAFAALAIAACSAFSMNLTEQDLSRIARRGSGSACRSISNGYVYWQAGNSDETSYAFSIAPANHWDLVDCIAIIEAGTKTTGSAEGQRAAQTSPLQEARFFDAPRRLAICRDAILTRDFDKLSDIVELDSNLMHAVMMTSTPPLFYWKPASLDLILNIRQWRKHGLPVFYTFDAGPNAHLITTEKYKSILESKLLELPYVHSILTAHPGAGASIISSH